MQFITRQLRLVLTLGMFAFSGMALVAQTEVVAPPADVEIAQPAMPLTTVSFDSDGHDFGEIKEGKVVSHTFTFKNTGSNPLRCINVKPSCGCTTPDWTKDDIAPGAEGFVKVQFDSKGKQGIQKKTVTVTFENTEPANIILSFMGEVIIENVPAEEWDMTLRAPGDLPVTNDSDMDGVADIDGAKEAPIAPTKEDAAKEAAAPQVHYATPVPPMATSTAKFKEDSHDFGDLKENVRVTHTFKFKNTGKEPLEIELVKPSCGCTTPDWSKGPIAPGKKGFVTIEFDTKAKRGIQKKSVTVTFVNTDPKNKILNFSANVLE